MANGRLRMAAGMLLLMMFVVAEAFEVAEESSLGGEGNRSLLSFKKGKKGKKGRNGKKGSRRISRPQGPAPSVPVRVQNPPPQRPAPTVTPRPTTTPGPVGGFNPSGFNFPRPNLQAPGNFGTTTSLTTGFIVVVVLGNGQMCFTQSSSFITTNTKRMGAGAFVETYGTLEGTFRCAEGARGFGIAILTGQAFAEVQRIGQECRTRLANNSQGFSQVVGTGIEVGVRGEFGGTVRCPEKKG